MMLNTNNRLKKTLYLLFTTPYALGKNNGFQKGGVKWSL